MQTCSICTYLDWNARRERAVRRGSVLPFSCHHPVIVTIKADVPRVSQVRLKLPKFEPQFDQTRPADTSKQIQAFACFLLHAAGDVLNTYAYYGIIPTNTYALHPTAVNPLYDTTGAACATV